MTIKQIIRKYLDENGYDGLCLPDLECGCGLDDFAPCPDGINEECEPAYRIKNEDLSEEERNRQLHQYGNIGDVFIRAQKER